MPRLGEIKLQIEGVSQIELLKYQEILHALIGSGGLQIKAGKTCIHFDNNGVFQGIQIDFWPYKRKLSTGA